MTVEFEAKSEVSTKSSFARRFSSTIVQATHRDQPWSRIEYLGFASLIILWLATLVGTWGNWGNLTIDCGREMYVPAALLKGKVLYRDIWYLYGPAAPYFNTSLFRIFGVRLTVLYMAGALSALGCALFLYLSGSELRFSLAGWCAGVALILQAFGPLLFCFPLPYSFASVYGCLVACLFLWMAIRASRSSGPFSLFLLGILAAIALLLKLEYGFACYAALALMIALGQWPQTDGKRFRRELLAIAPGVALCTVVIVWMTGLRGADFIIHDNFMSWPSSFFMKKYGREWLASTGLAWNLHALLAAAKNTVIYVLTILAVYWVFSGKRNRKFFILGAVILAALVALPALSDKVRNVGAFFPHPMPLYAVASAALMSFAALWKKTKPLSVGLLVACAFSSLLAMRMLLDLHPRLYAIYYDGPVILCHLMLMSLIFRTLRAEPLTMRWDERFIYAACLGVVTLVTTPIFRNTGHRVWLRSDYGSVRADPEQARAYAQAIAFLKEKAAAQEEVLSVPEDTSLYFLSGTDCPIRVIEFTPGLVAPGRMSDELFADLQRRKPRYLVWSNRTFPEYGVPRFGVDFDQVLGNYFFLHYQPTKQIFGQQDGWHATVWERTSERASQSPAHE